MNNSFLRTLLNYFLVFSIIAFSGIVTFSGNTTLVVINFLLVSCIFIFVKKSIDINIFKFIIIFISIFVIQAIDFEYFYFREFISLIISIILPFMVIKLVGKKYIPIYINIIYIYAIISFIIIILSYISSGFYNFTSNLANILHTDPLPYQDESFIIYNFEPKSLNGLIRNPGPFWEPGAFGIFLNLALVLNIIYSGEIFSKKNIVFIVAVISTFSTGSYVVLSAIILYMIIHKSTKKIYTFIISIILLLPFIIILFNVFESIDFLLPKIERQFYNQTERYYSAGHIGRFGSALADLQELKGHYLFGRGLQDETRYEYSTGSTNGTTDFLSRFGLIGVLFIIFYWSKSLDKILIYYGNTKRLKYFLIFLFLLMAFNEIILSKPVFMVFLYFYMVYPKEIPNSGNSLVYNTNLNYKQSKGNVYAQNIN